MDKVILNGNKARFYNEGNTQSGSIQYTDSKLSIKGNSAGSGVLITDGKLHLKSGTSTSSIIYDSNTQGVQFPDGLIIIGSGSTVSSVYNDNGNVHIDSGITVSNLNIEYTEGVAANIQGRVQFGSGLATGYSSHAQGSGTIASGDGTHAQGQYTIANGNYSHAQGFISTTGKRIYAQFIIPAESFSLIISNASTYFEPGPTVVISDDMFPICSINITNVTTNAITASCSADYIGSEFYFIISNRYPYNGFASHAQGNNTQANGYSSHAQGHNTIATGYSSHAQGSGTIASGDVSHAQGLGTTTSIGYQHASGKYNAVDNNAIFIVGVGSSAARENGFWVTLTGQANAGLGFSSSGYLKVGGQSTMSNALVQNRLQVGSLDSGAGHYHQQIGEEQTEFVIHSEPWGGNVIRIDGSGRFILIDEANGFNVGIGVENPSDTLEVLDVIAVTNSAYGIARLAGDYVGGELGVTDNLDNVIAAKSWDGTFRYGGPLNEPYLIVEGGSLRSNTYASGFVGNGWIISKSIVPSDRYTAVFDDLWVRGSMNVYEMVINQIRATNGSLWVSDAGKATYAIYSSTANSIGLNFQTGSLLPFVTGDILRSKRWGTSGSTTQSVWDIVTTVSAVNYGAGTLTISAPVANGTYCYTASSNGTWPIFTAKINGSGSQWVRVGNVSDIDRRGSIYLTSNDLGGPFIDVIDQISSSALALTPGDKTKVRLGKLDNLSAGGFTNMSGYGLYADNVYLRGTISATAGTFSGKVTANQGSIGGWNLTNDSLWKHQMVLLATENYQFISINQGVSGYNQVGVYIGSGLDYGNYVSMVDSDEINKFLWDGANLGITTSKFTLSNGIIYAQDAILSGSIRANAGYIGGLGGWTIKTGYITSSGIQIKGGTSPAIKIGAASYGDHGIWLGKGNYYSASFWNTSLARGLKWDGQKLIVSASNFSLDANGKISANQAVISGSISSSAGQIGGWSLGSSELSSSGIVLNSSNPSIVLGGFNPLVMSDDNGVALWKNLSGQYSFFVGKRGRFPVDSDAYLQWDGSNLLISSQFFNLNSGRMTASGGQIGQWTISYNAVSANGVTLSSGTNPYIGIGTATHNGTGIFLGKSNNASMSIWSANNRGLTWNGSALIISGSNFTLSSEGSISASNAVIGGTIYANSGKIGDTNGWAIGTGKLSSANSQIFLTSSATYPSLRIYTTSAPSGYNSGYKNYIYLGLYSSVPKFQLIGNTNYFKWDSTKSTIKADNFELNESGTIIANNAIISGSISSSAGSIGGWNINFSGITATHPTGIISVTKQGSTILQVIDQNGNFLYSANNASLFNNIIDYYQKKQNYAKLTVYTGVSTSIATGGETWSGVGYNVQQQGVSFYNLFTYTASGLTPNKQYILQLNMHNFKVDGDAGYQGSRQNYKSPSFIWAWISDLAEATPVQESVGGQYVMNPLFNLGEQGIKQFKFTATAQDMYIKSMYTLRHLDNNVHTTSFTFSGFRIDEFQHFTELSDKGLIVFNNPSNYLQLSSGDNIDNASNGAIDSFNINKLNVNQVHIQDPKYRNAPVFVDVYTESLSSNLNISSSLLLSMGGFNTDQVNVSVPVQVQVYRLTDTTVWTQVTDYPVRLKSLDNINLLSRIEIDLPESSGTYSVGTTFRVV